MGGWISDPKVPLAPGNCIFVFSARARTLSKCQNGSNPTTSLFAAGGGPTRKKRSFPRRVHTTIPDSLVPFFFHSGTPSAEEPARGPAELAACLLPLDAQAPPKRPNRLRNRLKYYVLQLGDPTVDPYPNQVLDMSSTYYDEYSDYESAPGEHDEDLGVLAQSCPNLHVLDLSGHQDAAYASFSAEGLSDALQSMRRLHTLYFYENGRKYSYPWLMANIRSRTNILHSFDTMDPRGIPRTPMEVDDDDSADDDSDYDDDE